VHIFSEVPQMWSASLITIIFGVVNIQQNRRCCWLVVQWCVIGICKSVNLAIKEISTLSRIRSAWPFKMGLICCPEMSVINCQYVPANSGLDWSVADAWNLIFLNLF
jgi:hypothetical protein